jgi:predicted RND superfamily exporter protein
MVMLILGVTFFLGSQIKRLNIDMDTDIWAPQSHPYVKATKVLEDVFGGKNFVLIGVVPKEGDVFQADVLAKIKRIQEGIEQIPEAVRHNVISLAARKVKDIKGTRDGMEVHQIMETIPQTPEEIKQLRKDIFSNPIYINALVSSDGKAASVIADFKLKKDSPSYAALYKAIQNVVDKERDSRTDIYIGGTPIYLNWIEFYMMKMPMYFGIALIIIILIQYWSFRSLQGMLLPIVTALVSVVWGLGFMGLMGVHMDPMNTNTPILIMAVAAGHAIQILKRYYEEYYRLKTSGAPLSSARAISASAVIESLTAVGPSMITAGLIAATTFYSLTANELAVVRHFGFFSGSGVMAALILEMTFIPAVRSLLSPPKARESEREQQTGVLDRLLHTLADNLVGGRAPWILGGVLLLIMLAFVGVFKLQTDNSFKRYHAEKSEVRVHDEALNARFGGTNSIYFLIEGQGQDSLKNPEVLKGIASLQDFLNQQPGVGKTQSIVDLIKRMNQAMHADNPQYFDVPLSRELIAQYLLLYSLSGDPQDLDNFVDNDYQKAALWVYVKDDSTAFADSLYKQASAIIEKNFPPGVTVRMGGALPETTAINEVLTNGKLKNMLQMAMVVFVLSSIALRSLVGGLFVVTPLIMIVLANFGLMGWLGVPLDMGVATTASMAIGIGADYEIYLLFRFREELTRTGSILLATRNSLLTSGKAILFVALSIAGGYAVLLFTGFGFYTRLSTMVIVTMICSSLSALLFLRSMMMIFKPRFVFGNARNELFSNIYTRPEGEL